jgi:Domain of unknown function (DUF4173)
MKLKNIFLFFSVIGYSCLFYKQTSGINCLILNLFLIIFSGVINPRIIKKKYWQLASAGAIISASMIVFHNSELAAFTNVTSLILVTGLSYNQQTSLYISALHGLISIIVPFFTNIIQYLTDLANPKIPKSNGLFSLKTVSIYVIPLTITLVFYALYASANPVFGSLIKIPELNISLNLVAFTFVGWIVLSGFFSPFGSEDLVKWDISKTDILSRIKLKIKHTFEMTALKLEHKKGVIMLVMLNLLLLFFNIFDLLFILSGKKLPDGVDYSQYVHNGVNTLIFSILLAIGIILYYFRANLNFYKKNQWLLRLTYLWILQNGLLLLGIIHKNQIYINEYGLTYKRIGVYFYLLLTCIGLLTTFWKVRHLKSIWFLLRKNTLIAYIVLIVSCLVNWDRLIAQNQINEAKHIDVIYLSNLSDTVLPELKSLLTNKRLNLNVQIKDFTQKFSSTNGDLNGSTPIISQRKFIENQLKKFNENYSKKDWQSWNYDDLRVFRSLNGKGI